MPVDPKIVLKLLVDKFGTNINRVPTREESKLATRLELILKNHETCEFIEDDTVDLDEENSEYEAQDEINDDWSPPDELEEVGKSMEHWTINGNEFSTEKIMEMHNFYTYNGSDNRRTLSSVSHKYK